MRNLRTCQTCANCKHVEEICEQDEAPMYYCGFGQPPRPPTCMEAHTPDQTNEEFDKVSDAFMEWSKGREVRAYKVCDDYEAQA